MKTDNKSQYTSYPGRRADFYNYIATEDELAASLLAKNIRKLLQRSPTAIAKQITSNNDEYPTKTDEKKEHLDNRIFSSDSSLSSICSTYSTDSCGSTDSLKENKPKESTFKVSMPKGMLNRMVRDLVRMGEGEKNGIRGCCLTIELSDDIAVYNIGKIRCDPKIETSHSLRLRLTSFTSTETTPVPIMIIGRIFKNTQQMLHIKPGYFIEKVRH